MATILIFLSVIETTKKDHWEKKERNVYQADMLALAIIAIINDIKIKLIGPSCKKQQQKTAIFNKRR